MGKFGRLLVVSVLMIPLVGAGCRSHRVRWTPDEQSHYAQWEHETNRQHEDYDRRSRDEQNQYHNWRRNHR